ncbi:penicillin-binding protein 1C [Profundibacter amoris]|uniref:peptidoglycan glycosyltransferase n=1 Tax=Profundibacter amoris TaxID=2171755 RepID=A0A347UC93_9RHOB|nr:penicillin-binding protein 1C [Profundibacter amoris]AXX96471.1 penicillin-binding protein 1C [Profundibacter amoris]
MIRRHALLTLALLLFITAAARDAFDDWVDSTVLPPLAAETSAEVLDRNGTLLRAYTVADGRWRLRTKLDAVDATYIKMLIAYEDKRFYSHAGVDPVAMLRAAYQALTQGKIVSGGSTLTMQTARLLEDGTTGKWAGKLRQIRLALALERRLSKDEILTLYLNRAPFGGNLEGVRAATRAYFGKEPRRLTPAQAALLVALPQAPEVRRPDRYRDAARAARTRVVERMLSAGVLDSDMAKTAGSEPIPAQKHPFPALSPHMADRAVAENARQLTLDATLQRQLETLAAAALQGKGDDLSIAILVADHTTGEILASVGSAAYRADSRLGFVDMTRALRSPGSTLKPLVYGMAFDQGLAHPETLIDDVPTAFGAYVPQNFDGKFRGTIRIRRALQLSLNIPAIKLTEAIGPANLMSALRRAGMDPVVPGGKPGLAIALGGLGVTLTDMVQLYAGLANGGKPRPLIWKSGSNTGEIGRNLISPVAAWYVADILSGLAPPPNAPRNRLAYKTGTSYGHRDAWALGFDGQHVVGVWLGRADGTPVPGAFGGGLAAPVLFEVFSRIKPALTPLPSPPPAALTISNADLPQPLQRFRGRNALFEKPKDAPTVAFPPDGSEVEADGGFLVVKVRDGVAPFTWLANGKPFAVATYERQSLLETEGAGFITLSVIDAKGRSARAEIRLN